MIGKLERQFTLSAWLLTCTVVAVMMAVICVLGIRQAEDAYRGSLDNYSNAITSKISLDSKISDYWLGELEETGRLVICLSDNGGDILFPGRYSPATDREVLLAEAEEHAERAELFVSDFSFEDTLLHAEYEIFGEHGEKYLGRSEIINLPTGRAVLTILMELQGFREQRNNIIATYVVIALIAMATLFLISTFLSCKAVRPVEHSIKQQKEFVAAASHELRSPLAVLKAGASAAKLSGNCEDFLGVVDSEVDRMARLVDDLLALTRADAGNWETEKSDIDTETLLLEIYERNVPIAASYGRELKLRVPGNLLPIAVGDSMRARQVVEILLNNAFEHSTPHTEVVLGADLRRNRLEIYVEDMGPGIPDEQKKKVFERFFRADQSRTRKEHFGLGLSVAQEYARLMGGTLTLRDSPHGGSVFSLNLGVKQKK